MNGKAINISNGAETAGQSGLVRCREEDTGHVQREQELRDGRYIGQERMFDREGRLQRERTVNERGSSHGRPNGKVRREKTADSGRTPGAVRRFDAAGRVERVSLHGDGQTLFHVETNGRGQPTRLLCPRASVLPEDRKPAASMAPPAPRCPWPHAPHGAQAVGRCGQARSDDALLEDGSRQHGAGGLDS